MEAKLEIGLLFGVLAIALFVYARQRHGSMRSALALLAGFLASLTVALGSVSEGAGEVIAFFE